MTRPMKGATVDDADDDRATVREVGHLGIGRDRQGRVRRRHGEHVVGFADRGFLAMKFLAVPAADATFLVRPDAGVRHVFLAEHDIRPVGEAVQRLDPRLGVGNVVEPVGNFIGRAIVL